MAAAASGCGAGAGGERVRVRVRAATRADVTHIHRMIRELAAFEGVTDAPQLSVEDLILDGFESSPAWFFALVAVLEDGGGAGDAGGDVVGYALCNRAYSSWTRRAYYVEDLYVRPEWHGRGIGKQLLAHLCQMGVREGVGRVDWHVLESNTGARAFYSRLGARCLRETEGRAALRLDATHIHALAAAAAPAAPPADELDPPPQ